MASNFYSGSAICVADGKGRFVLPLEMRKTVRLHSADDTKICINLHKTLDCAIGYGLSYQTALEEKIAARERVAIERGDDFDAVGERMRSFGDVEVVNFDDAGRFFLPTPFRKRLKIDDALVFFGASTELQIWEPHTLLASGQCTPITQDKVADFLADRGASV